MARKNKSTLVPNLRFNDTPGVVDKKPKAAVLPPPPPPIDDVPIHIACPFCSLPFKSTPLLLTCGHSLCEKCVGHFKRMLKCKCIPKCPICQETVKSVVNNFILDGVVEKLAKETKKTPVIDYFGEYSELKQKIQELTKQNEDIELEIVNWQKLHDLKQKEIDAFRANSNEVLDRSAFLYLILTVLIVVLIIWFCFSGYIYPLKQNQIIGKTR